MGWLLLELSQVLFSVDYFALEIWKFQVCIVFSSRSLSGCDGVLEHLVAKK